MADIRLPELKPAQVDIPNVFARGYAVADQMQTPGLVNALSKAKLTQEQNQIAAANEYAATGDPTALRGGYPVQSMAFDEAEHKRRIESMKPGLDYAYMISPMLNPENYQFHRQKAVEMSPALEAVFPPEYDAAKIAAFQGAYKEKMKLEKAQNYYMSGGVPVPFGGGGSKLMGGREPLGPDDIRANAQARAEGTIAGGGGRGASGKGATGPQFRQKLYQDYLNDPNIPPEKRNYGGFLEYEAINKRPGYDRTSTNARGQESTTKTRPYQTPVTTTVDKAFEGATGFNPMSPTVLPTAPPPPAGITNFGPPVGKTEDGRMVYKDANGNPITID